MLSNFFQTHFASFVQIVTFSIRLLAHIHLNKMVLSIGNTINSLTLFSHFSLRRISLTTGGRRSHDTTYLKNCLPSMHLKVSCPFMIPLEIPLHCLSPNSPLLLFFLEFLVVLPLSKILHPHSPNWSHELS